MSQSPLDVRRSGTFVIGSANSRWSAASLDKRTSVGQRRNTFLGGDRRWDEPLFYFQESVETEKPIEQPKHWSAGKWFLLFANSLTFILGTLGLVACILVLLDVVPNGTIVSSLHSDVVVGGFVLSSLMLLNSLFAYVGILKESKAILTFYVVFMWPLFIAIIVYAYISLNASYLDNLTDELLRRWGGMTENQRLYAQNYYSCCGLLAADDNPAASDTCNILSDQPGCYTLLSNFSLSLLTWAYTCFFGAAGIQMLAIFTGVLFGNHVTVKKFIG